MKKLFKLKEKLSASILSFIYTFLTMFGTSYFIKGNSFMIFRYFYLSIPIFIILFFIIRLLIIYLYKFLDSKKWINMKSKYEEKFNKHPFLISVCFIILCWLPYIISFYPAILSPDPSFQIKQYFKIPNKYSDYSVMIDPDVTITNHHPVVHTLLLGTSLKIGHSIGNDNLGLFIYSIIQITILSCTLAYTLKYMTDKKVNIIYRLIALGIYSLVPMFPLYSMSAVKDVIYSSFIILYTILLYDLVKRKEKLEVKKCIFIFLLLMLIILFRNNGYYVILLSLPFLLFNKFIRKSILILYIAIIGFNYTYNDIILPYFRVTPSSVREMLSIPFQQTARYVKYNDIEDEEYKVYDNILDMSDLASRYNPELSDPVKNRYNKYTTDEELKEYFGYWFKGLIKDPVTYIDATVNNVYGYFYPPKTNWYVYYKYDTRIVQDNFDYHYNNLDMSRKVLSYYGLGFPYIPVVGLISNIGFNTWILFLFIAYLFYKRKYNGIIYLAPALVTLLICVASPANTYFRYAMPYVFAMPLMIGLFLKEVENEEK